MGCRCGNFVLISFNLVESLHRGKPDITGLGLSNKQPLQQLHPHLPFYTF